MRRTTINITEVTDRQLEALRERGHGTLTAVVRTAIDRMYQQEVQEMNRVAELAEGIYSGVYGSLDSKRMRTRMTQEIEDWLEQGEPLTGDETVESLARQWRREHVGDDEIVDRLGAESWVQVELEYMGLSQCEILAKLDEMFPTEDNDALARRIVSAL